MYRLLAICSAVGLVFGGLGCQSCCEHSHIAGRCDCFEPEWGCHYDMYYHGPVATAPLAAPVETLKALPKE